MLEHYPTGLLLGSPQHGIVYEMARATKRANL